MNQNRGLGKGKVVIALAATAMAAAAANAALVSISTVVTNNTAAEKIYEFNVSSLLTNSSLNVGGMGSLAIVVTDIRGGGAYIKSVGPQAIYSSFVRNSMVAQLARPVSTVTPWSILAGQFGQSSYSSTFATQSYSMPGNSDDEIRTQLKFVLSAGDQVAISSTFEVENFAVPTPGALALICVAGGFGVRGRRRVQG